MKSSYRSDIKLGDRYRDVQTGYEGIATAVYFFQHGCERVVLEQWVEARADMKELTFDAPRLQHVTTGRVATTDRTGGDRPAPGAKRGPA